MPLQVVPECPYCGVECYGRFACWAHSDVAALEREAVDKPVEERELLADLYDAVIESARDARPARG